jgi:hypothetical protein
MLPTDRIVALYFPFRLEEMSFGDGIFGSAESPEDVPRALLSSEKPAMSEPKPTTR